jgi:hypothetical protein
MASDNAMPGIGPSFNEVEDAHRAARHRSDRTGQHTDAQSAELAGAGVAFHTETSAPMQVGAKLSAAVNTMESVANSAPTKGQQPLRSAHQAATPIAASGIGTPRRRPEDF